MLVILENKGIQQGITSFGWYLQSRYAFLNICLLEYIQRRHKMQPGKKLSQVQQDYLVDVIMTWIQREMERG